MAVSGFRINVSGPMRTARNVGKIRASEFKPVIKQYLRQSLNTAARTTPERSLSLIRRNQSKQYDNRINFIPSSHSLEDGSLRIRNGIHWLWSGGRWYQANKWNLPPRVYAEYQALLQEHERRKKTNRNKFITDRAQARHLYRKSWTQVANSLGVSIATPQKVAASYSRHNPSKEPRRGFGQWRGGKNVLTAVVYNPFLDEPSQYKDFTARDILAPAMAQHKGEFDRNFQRALQLRLRQAARA